MPGDALVCDSDCDLNGDESSDGSRGLAEWAAEFNIQTVLSALLKLLRRKGLDIPVDIPELLCPLADFAM